MKSSKKRIFCVNPPVAETDVRCTREGRCNGEEGGWTETHPPVTLASIAGHVRQYGHEVKLFDGIGSNKTWADFENELTEFKPDVVVINTAVPTIENDLRICDMAKKHFPACITVAYGLFPSVALDDAKKLQPKMDFWLQGDPETPVLQIAEDKKPAAGFWLEPDLDKLAIPAYELLPDYHFALTGERWMFLIDGRGCPHKCIYCVAPTLTKGNVRYKSVERVIEEMEYLVRKLNIKVLMFWDELFTFNRERVVKICNMMIERGLNKECKWLATTRVDRVDEDLFRLMKKAGCKIVSFGIESGNQEVLNKAKKGIRVEQSAKAIAAAKKAGIGTIGHFILGLPGSTKKTEEETIKFAKKIGVDFAQFYCCTPFPGSELYDMALKNGWTPAIDWRNVRQSMATISYPDFPSEEIQKMRRKAYLSFYMRPHVVKSFFAVSSVSGAVQAVPKALKFFKWMRK